MRQSQVCLFVCLFVCQKDKLCELDFKARSEDGCKCVCECECGSVYVYVYMNVFV